MNLPITIEGTEPGHDGPITLDELDAALNIASNEEPVGRRPRMLQFTQEQFDAHVALARALERHRLVNTPETREFLQGVSLEAQHQRERWGSEHDAGKTPFDWVFLVGHLATRAAMNYMADNQEKALHHAITTAAACANWHAAMQGECDMRPGLPHEGATLERKG